MVQFGLAWKINIKYNAITSSDSYSKITFIRQIFLHILSNLILITVQFCRRGCAVSSSSALSLSTLPTYAAKSR